MKAILSGFVTLGLFASSVSAQQEGDKTVPETADNVAPEGFTQLFNGKDLTNWKGVMLKPFDKPHKRVNLDPAKAAEQQLKADKIMTAHWTVNPEGELFFDGKKGGFSLATAKDYGDFEFHVSWKIEEHGDSGVYIRGLPQIQIWDTESPKSKRFGAPKGSGALWNNPKEGKWPLVKADKPVGEWNHFFVRMVGDKVSIWLNGKQTVNEAPLFNLWQKKEPIPKTGQIELQCHGHPIWFKNIYIKEL